MCLTILYVHTYTYSIYLDMIPDTGTVLYLVLELDTDTWIGTGFLTSRALQSCVTTTQMYLALRAMVTNIQLIRRQLFLRTIFET